MSSIITISSVSGTPPYSVYVCNTLGSSCVFVASGITTIPITITLPSTFDRVPAVMVKIKDSLNCETFSIETCSEGDYLLVFTMNNCGNAIATSGGTLNGRPFYNYLATYNGIQPPDTFTIYWDSGNTRWNVQNVVTNDICVVLPFDRPTPIGNYGEWTLGPDSPCYCIAGVFANYYTQLTG